MTKFVRQNLMSLSMAVMFLAGSGVIQAQQTDNPEVKVYNITNYGYIYDLSESGETIDFGKIDLKKTVEKIYYLQITNARVEQVNVTSTDGKMFDPTVSAVPSDKTDADGNPYYEFKVAAHSGTEEGDFTGIVTVGVPGGNTLSFNTSLNVVNLSKSTISEFKETAMAVGWNAEVNYVGDALINNVEYTVNPNTGAKSSIKAFIGDSTGDICLEIQKYDPQLQPGRHIKFSSHTSSRDLDNASWPCVSYKLEAETEWTHPEWTQLITAPVKADVGKYVSVKGCVFESQTAPQGSDGKFYMTFTKDGEKVKCVVPNNLNNYFNGLPEICKTGEVEIIGSIVLDIIDWNIGNETFIIPKYIRKGTPEKGLETGDWMIEAINLTAGRTDKWKATINSTDDPFVYEIEKFIENKDGKIKMILAPEGNAIDILTGDMFKYSENYLQTWIDDEEEGSRALLGRGSNIRLLIDENGKITNPNYFGYIYSGDSGMVEYVWDKNSIWVKHVAPSFTINEYQPWGLTALEPGAEISIRRTCVGRSYTDSTYRVLLNDDTQPSDLNFTLEHPEYFDISLSEPKDDRGTYYSLILTLKPQDEVGTYISSFTVSDKNGVSQTFTLKAEVLDLRCATIREFKEKAVTMRLSDEIVYTGMAHVNANENGIFASDESGSIMLSCLPGVSGKITPGMYISFSGCAVYISGKPEEDVKYPTWKCISADRCMNLYPTWAYPERVTLTSEPTSDDCGKYVSVKNVTFKSESIDYLEGMFASEDGTHLLWYEFEDENGNIYKVHPEGGAKNRYGFGIPEEYKNTENPVKLEIVGYCYGTSRTNGYPQPYINPQYIRPVQPKEPLPEGEWQMNAYSIMWDTQEKPWTVTVTQDKDNPYLYEFQDFVYGNGHSASSDTHCVVKGELDDTCKELHLFSGNPFDLGTYSESVECWFAFVKDFDRTGATPEQEPLARGSVAICPREGNTITIPVGFSYTVYGNEWSDPEHIYWANRWSHYGLWKEDATLTAVIPYPVPQNLTAQVDENNVVLRWDPVVTSEYELKGYTVYYNDNVVDKTPADITTYTVGNVRGKARFKVTAIYGEGDESKPSNEVEVSVSGVDDAESIISVNAIPGAVEVSANGEMVRIVSSSGMTVYSGCITGTERVNVTSGIYIVNVNGKIHKLFVK